MRILTALFIIFLNSQLALGMQLCTGRPPSVGSCAGGGDGYIGREDSAGTTAECGGTCTTNYLYYSKFIVETGENQEDGTVTYSHWDTISVNAGVRSGIWNTSGELVVGAAEQSGTDSNPDSFDVAITSTCLAAGTYYIGVWVEGDAWAGVSTTAFDLGVWTRTVEVATFGNMCGTPETCGSETAANGQVVVWFDNSASR